MEDPVDFIKKKYGDNVRVLYMPNGGNQGDNLIAAATIQAFNRNGLKWQFLAGGAEQVRDGDVCVYGGGGALVDMYEGGVACLRFLQSLGRPVLVLPHTVRGHEDFWRASSGMTVFCRDALSLEYLSGMPGVEAHGACDMAFGLSFQDDCLAAVKSFRDAIGERSSLVLDIFRGDGEAGRRPKGMKSWVDLSAIYYPKLNSTQSIMANAACFLTALAPARLVRTDRLHVAVGAGLLGIEVHLYDNNYGKNSAVMEMAGFRLSSVRLMES